MAFAPPQPLLQRQQHPFPAAQPLSEEKLQEKGECLPWPGEVVCCA